LLTAPDLTRRVIAVGDETDRPTAPIGDDPSVQADAVQADAVLLP
jgi:hypothetical protein